MAAQPTDYSSLSITEIRSRDVVRDRPHMFFGCHREDPRLAGAVVEALVQDTLREPDRQTPRAGVAVAVVIESDHRFTVTDNVINEMDELDSHGLPRSRWSLGALIAVSARARIEIRTADRHWLREFEGATPTESPGEQEPIGSPGTRVTCELDRTYFSVTTVLPTAEHLWDPRDARVTVTDLRG